jgi:hypothetical protein
MAISSTAICNLALDAAMCRSSISAIGEASAEGQACARHYEPALEAVLRGVHWNFARKQVTLSLLKDGTVTPSQNVPQPWLYEYAYPSDCLLARAMLPQMNNPQGMPVAGGWQPPQPQMPVARFLVAQDNDVSGNPVQVMLTNVPQAQLIYTCLVSNTNLFDAMFVELLVLYLASRICRPLTGDKQHALSLYQQAEEMRKMAASMNGNEGPVVIDTVPDWIRVRGLAWDWETSPGGINCWGNPLPLTMVI